MFPGSIDWGSLAQQWIQMRDNTNRTMPEAPPPPNISGISHGGPSVSETSARRNENQKSKFEEQGEADMELADDEDHAEKSVKSLDAESATMQLMQQTVGASVENALIMQPQWFVQTAQATPLAVPSQLTPAATQWNMWPPRVSVPPPSLPGAAISSTSHIPSLLKLNVPNPNVIKPVSDIIDPTVVDPNAGNSSIACGATEAAKRKILPAWIREGLEKMEREKQKQMEREHYEQPNSDSLHSKLQADTNEGGSLIDYTVKKNTEDKILESDSSCNEGEDADAVPVATKTNALATSAAQSENDNSDIDGVQISGKSYEEKLNDLMILVRGTLTELLLEVTTEEITNIAQETLKHEKMKASSAQVVRKSDLSSITGKLGLAAYADSSSDESNDSDNELKTGKDNDGNDSEEELRNTIRMKRRAFAKTSAEIEQRIAAAAAREEQKLKYYTQLEENQQLNLKSEESHAGKSHHLTIERKRHDDHYGDKHSSMSSGGKTIERDFGETTTVSKLHQSNGKRQRDRHQRKERTTRFSDNKEPKMAATVSGANINYISQMHYPIPSANAEPLRTLSSSSSVGAKLNNVPNPVDSLLMKVNKIKTSPSKNDRRRHRSRSRSRSRRSGRGEAESSSSTTSSDTDSSSSSSSRSSKSSTNRKRRRGRDESSRSRYRKTSSSSYHRRDYKKGYNHKKDRRDRKYYSSDSDDGSHYRKRSHHSRRFSKSRSISRSQSKSSHSSSRHRR